MVAYWVVIEKLLYVRCVMSGSLVVSYVKVGWNVGLWSLVGSMATVRRAY